MSPFVGCACFGFESLLPGAGSDVKPKLEISRSTKLSGANTSDLRLLISDFRLLITTRRHDLLLLLSFCIIDGDQFNHGPSQSWIMLFTH
jgi:hypothetical protein